MSNTEDVIALLRYMFDALNEIRGKQYIHVIEDLFVQSYIECETAVVNYHIREPN